VNPNQSDLSDDPFSQFRLAGKVAIVTGASSGLGAHFVQTLHAAGAEVIATARRSDLLEGVCAGLAHASWIPADLMLAEERERLVSEVVVSHGKVDVLVNNAGMSRPGPIESESLQDFRTVLELNVTAIWHMTKLVGEFMVKAGCGSIVNMASIFGHVASAPMSQANYVASKGAVMNLTREIAVQWARKGVRVNALCPGFFPSEGTEGVVSDPKTLAYVERATPMGRMGELGELDGPLLLLCSDASRYMTGASLLVDGGWTAR
jgi:NAD(P)-dependent dehydrogenase (short-subunit alcohol dehydrogenase family)